MGNEGALFFEFLGLQLKKKMRRHGKKKSWKSREWGVALNEEAGWMCAELGQGKGNEGVGPDMRERREGKGSRCWAEKGVGLDWSLA